jgi:hypothetical protein
VGSHGKWVSDAELAQAGIGADARSEPLYAMYLADGGVTAASLAPPGPGGSCPHGYLASGSFCVPAQGAQDAIAMPPNGTCPWGWIASGSYCLRSGNGR